MKPILSFTSWCGLTHFEECYPRPRPKGLGTSISQFYQDPKYLAEDALSVEVWLLTDRGLVGVIASSHTGDVPAWGEVWARRPQRLGAY